MKFIKTYAATLIVCFTFMFFGGWMLFDFSKRFYVATAACAFVIAVVLSAFAAQEKQIEQLEKRIEALEEQNAQEHGEKTDRICRPPAAAPGAVFRFAVSKKDKEF